MKNAVFCDMASYGFIVNRRLTLFLARVISSTLEMEATRSSETSVHKPTRRQSQKAAFFTINLPIKQKDKKQRGRKENFISKIFKIVDLMQNKRLYQSEKTVSLV
jgi:hypothetical protein